MAEEEDIFEIIMGENDDNLLLTDGEGNDVEFEQVAYIPLEDKDYAILAPVEPMEGVGENEALAFELVTYKDGAHGLEIVDDEDIVNAVFDEYNRLFEEEMQDE